jgi:hypothetical protein
MGLVTRFPPSLPPNSGAIGLPCLAIGPPTRTAATCGPHIGSAATVGDGKCALAGGRFTTNLRLFSDRHDVQVVATLVNRAVLALIGAALGGMSVIMLLAHGSWRAGQHDQAGAVRAGFAQLTHLPLSGLA